MAARQDSPYTETLRDTAVAVMQDDRLSVKTIGDAMGVSKQAASKFLNGGATGYEYGKRLETWLEERK